ncbi:DHH family phosphoesterase, partial [Magnetococcales bacterium HHB-1]
MPLKKRDKQSEEQENFSEDSPLKVEALTKILRRHSGERHAVVLQDFPDPDAISSAFAYRVMAGRFDIETDLIFSGRVSHQENLALINLLEIDLLKWNGQPLPKGRYHG